MLIRSKLLELGIDGVKMRTEILPKEYGITKQNGEPVNASYYSLAIAHKKDGELAVRIRDACWDYIDKHKRKG